QDAITRPRLDALPGRDRWRRRLTELHRAGLVTPPVVCRDRAFFLRRGPDQQHPVLIVRDPDGERVLIDPSALSPDDTVTLDAWEPSIEGDRLAYWLSEGGDEE